MPLVLLPHGGWDAEVAGLDENFDGGRSRDGGDGVGRVCLGAVV